MSNEINAKNIITKLNLGNFNKKLKNIRNVTLLRNVKVAKSIFVDIQPISNRKCESIWIVVWLFKKRRKKKLKKFE